MRHFLHQRFVNRIAARTGGMIHYGPFSTLKIPEDIYPMMTTGEMLGTYESCLHEPINRIITQKPETILLIGANHGYYSAGFCYTIRPQKLIAYEAEPRLVEVARNWWKINDLSPVEARGLATPDEFRTMKEKVDFIFCDCEGAEDDLLNPAAFEWQKNSIIISEMHDFYRPGVTERLISRFHHTHDIEIIHDNFEEDAINEKLLNTFIGPMPLFYRKELVRFPEHRWIIKNDQKIYCFGKFLVMWPKKKL